MRRNPVVRACPDVVTVKLGKEKPGKARRPVVKRDETGSLTQCRGHQLPVGQRKTFDGNPRE